MSNNKPSNNNEPPNDPIEPDREETSDIKTPSSKNTQFRAGSLTDPYFTPNFDDNSQDAKDNSIAIFEFDCIFLINKSTYCN